MASGAGRWAEVLDDTGAPANEGEALRTIAAALREAAEMVRDHEAMEVLRATGYRWWYDHRSYMDDAVLVGAVNLSPDMSPSFTDPADAILGTNGGDHD